MNTIFNCFKKDNFAIFIKEYYQAIPIKFPDNRFAPLTLLGVFKNKIRYLGSLTDEPFAKQWRAPKIRNLEISDINRATSSDIQSGLLLKLLAPFLSDSFELPIGSTNLKANKGAQVDMHFSVLNATKSFISPYDINFHLSNANIVLPMLNIIEKGGQIVLIDAIYSARQFAIEAKQGSDGNLVANIENQLAGSIIADRAIKRGSSMVLTGKKNTVFAFTCLGLNLGSFGQLNGIKIPSDSTQYPATPISTLPVDHVLLDDMGDLIFFDDAE